MSDKPAKLEHALQNPKIRLSAPNPQSKGKYATMQWDIWGNNPRIVVNTNDPAMATPDRGFGRIQAAMETPTFYAFLEMLKEAIAAAPGWKANLQMWSNPKGGGGPGVEPVPSADVWVGKDAEGVVFISVVKKEEGWPIIKFPFGAPDRRFVKVFHSDGSEYSKGDLSVVYAKAYLRLLGELMAAILTKTYEKPAPFIPGQRGGGGGGYGNRGGGGGGGYQQRSGGGSGGGGDVGGDDLPF